MRSEAAAPVASSSFRRASSPTVHPFHDYCGRSYQFELSRAGVVHDYLCYLIALNNPHPEAPTRDHADRIFFEAMELLNVGWVQKYLLYWGVRFGTWYNVRPTMIDYNTTRNATQVVRR
jgi:hypothetical protein